MSKLRNLLMSQTKDYVRDGLIYQLISPTSNTNIPLSTLNDSCTIEIVNKLTGTLPTSEYAGQCILWHNPSYSPYNHIGNYKADGTLLFYTQKASAQNLDNWALTVPSLVTPNVIRHQAYVLNKGELKKLIYLNGIRRYSNGVNINNGLGSFNTVTRSGIFSTYEIRIYNRALTDEEIMNNYLMDKEVYNII